MSSVKVKKVFKIIENTIYVLVFALLFYIIIGGLIARKNNTPYFAFGKSFNLIVTDSMEPEIMVGDLVVCKRAEISQVKVGDNVLFLSKSGVMSGKMIIHKAIRVEVIGGEINITTKGVNALGAESDYLTKDNFYGIMEFKSTFLGKLARFFSNWLNVVFLIIIYITIRVAVAQGIKLFREIKANKAAALKNYEDEIKDRINAEIETLKKAAQNNDNNDIKNNDDINKN